MDTSKNFMDTKIWICMLLHLKKYVILSAFFQIQKKYKDTNLN